MNVIHSSSFPVYCSLIFLGQEFVVLIESSRQSHLLLSRLSFLAKIAIDSALKKHFQLFVRRMVSGLNSFTFSIFCKGSIQQLLKDSYSTRLSDDFCSLVKRI